jgi:preprotein translocase SecE subunit
MTDRKKTTGRGQVAAVGETPSKQSVKADKTETTVKAGAREKTRQESVKLETKNTPRRETKERSGFAKWLHNNATARFLYEAYYELRHKVTWPSFREARNMTGVVIGLSAVVGVVLAAADFGLHRLFLLIIGAH